MYQLAFVYADTLVYWHNVILVLAVLTGMVFFWGVYHRRTGEFAGAVVACPICLILSILLARLAHWYFQPELYDSLIQAITGSAGSGYPLIGAFAGCLLGACLLRLMGTTGNLPALLDSMCIGGAAAISLGRLSNFFTPEDRGEILSRFTGLPFAYPTVNPTSGAEEPRFAVFLFQSLITGILFLYLLFSFMRSVKRKNHRDGHITLKFLLLYCASQIVMDSIRYDGLNLRSNRFISAIQVVCALVLLGILLYLSVKPGKKLLTVISWLLCLPAFGCCGYMEYYVQRHGDRAVFAYSVMSGCLLIIVFLCFRLLRPAKKEVFHEKHR